MMDTSMTMAEIESRFASEWVLIQDPHVGEANQVMGGQVVAHSKDRDEIYRYASSTPVDRFAIVYTGSLPENAAIVL